MTHADLAQIAALVGAAGSVLVLVPPPRRVLLVSGFALLAAAEAMLAVALVPEEDLERLGSAAGAAALVGGALAAAAGAGLLVRYPAATPVAVLLAAPFRLPVDLGSQHAFLLIPLYVVLAAAALGFVYRALKGGALPAIPLWLAVPAAALIAWVSLSLLWAIDLDEGSTELLFFIFPFAALLAVVARSPVPAWLPRGLAFTLIALASAFAVIGLYQAWTHTLIFGQDLRVANAYTTYFRVTSVFKDPSIYGRHLVLAIALVVVLLWLGRVRLLVASGLVALLFAGLYFSYSQSSMVVLFVTVLAATMVLADRRSRIAVVALALAAAVAGGAIAAVSARDSSLREATSGRSRLVSVTTTVIGNHPVIGVGVGSQPLASARENTGRRARDSRASHTTPLTVAAELGFVGVLLYLAFLAGAVNLLTAATRRSRVAGLGLSTAFFVLFVHSLFYSGFFEDPLMWGVLATGAAIVVSAPLPALEAAGETRAAEASPDGRRPGWRRSLRSRVEARWHT
jgi:hypothetical protein